MQRFLLVVGLVLGAALASTPGHAASRPPVPPTPVVAAANEIARAAGSHRLLLLGEMHGTREAPEIVGTLLDHYARSGPVVVALEVGVGEQPRIDRFLASEGGVADRASLLAGPFWQVDAKHNDGRRNASIVALIDRVRGLRRAGREVTVLAYDLGSLGTRDTASAESRDRAMARRIRTAYERLPRGRLLVLGGNVHAMRARPSYAPPEMQLPMGADFADLSPFSVNISAATGEFWGCSGGACGPMRAAPAAAASGPGDGEVYDYEIVLPAYSRARLVDGGTGSE